MVNDDVLRVEAGLVNDVVSLAGKFNGRYAPRLEALARKEGEPPQFSCVGSFSNNGLTGDDLSSSVFYAGKFDRREFSSDAETVLQGIKQFASCHVKGRPAVSLSGNDLDKIYHITPELAQNFYISASNISQRVTFTRFLGLMDAIGQPISHSLGLVSSKPRSMYMKERGRAVHMSAMAGDIADVADELLALRKENPRLMEEGFVNPYIASKTIKALTSQQVAPVEYVIFPDSDGPKPPTAH